MTWGRHPPNPSTSNLGKASPKPVYEIPSVIQARALSFNREARESQRMGRAPGRRWRRSIHPTARQSKNPLTPRPRIP